MSLAGVLFHKGQAVEFKKVVPGTHDPATGTYGAPVETVVRGKAMRAPGDSERYQALELIESESPTLLFVPDTEDELPTMDSAIEWGGTNYAVKDVSPLALNGTATAARIIVSR